MKEWEDFKVKIDMAVNEWFAKQCQDSNKSYRVYFLPATPEHDSGVLIASRKPANEGYMLAAPEPMRFYATIEQEQHRLKELFFRLPVLKH